MRRKHTAPRGQQSNLLGWIVILGCCLISWVVIIVLIVHFT